MTLNPTDAKRIYDEVMKNCCCITNPGECPLHDETGYTRDSETLNPPNPEDPPIAPRRNPATGRIILRITYQTELPCGDRYVLLEGQEDKEGRWKVTYNCHCGKTYFIERVATGLEVQEKP